MLRPSYSKWPYCCLLLFLNFHCKRSKIWLKGLSTTDSAGNQSQGAQRHWVGSQEVSWKLQSFTKSSKKLTMPRKTHVQAMTSLSEHRLMGPVPAKKWNIDHCTWKGGASDQGTAEVEDSLTRKPLLPAVIGEMCLYLPHQHRKLLSPLIFSQSPHEEPLTSPALLQSQPVMQNFPWRTAQHHVCEDSMSWNLPQNAPSWPVHIQGQKMLLLLKTNKIVCPTQAEETNLC